MRSYVTLRERIINRQVRFLDRTPAAGATLRVDPSAGTRSSGGPSAGTILGVVLVVALLYLGRDVLIPFAIAILLSFALAPIVTRLRHIGVPRVPAVLLIVTLAFTALGGLGMILGGQLMQIVNELPTYQANIVEKISSFRSAAPEGGALDRATSFVRELEEQLQPDSARPGQSEVPVVQVQEPQASPLQVLASVARPLLAPIAMAGIVIVFVVFMLLEREDLRNRLIRLIGSDLYLTTEAMNEAAHRVSRYLLMQLTVNATYGIPIGIGLYFIGVPGALLWGALAIVLRFIPYIGPFIAALFPLTLAIAVDPGWGTFLWALGLLVTVELVSNNVIEPWLYGTSTGVSVVAIIIAAVFWTMLWGPAGLFLSTPLTVCLAVIGRYVPQLRFLDILLGSAPALSPAERFYQRLLASDPDEGVQIADEYLKERSLADFYEEVALPALRLAEQDRVRDTALKESRVVVGGTLLEIVAELRDRDDPAQSESEENVAQTEWTGRPILCLAGRSTLDMGAAAMLAQLLERQGIPVRVLPAEAISREGIIGLDLREFEGVCLSYLGAAAVAQAQQVCRRLRRILPDTPILVGLFNHQVDKTKATAGTIPEARTVAVSFKEVIQRVREWSAAPSDARVNAPIPAQEEVRLCDLKALGLLDTPPEERFDRITRELASALHVPISLLTLVDERRQFWKSQTGLPDDLAHARQAPRESSICGHVVAENEILVIEDTRKDKRFASNEFLRERGIRFYAGAPLRSRNGQAIGALCVIDTVPRTFSASEKALLQVIADDVMTAIEADIAEVPPEDPSMGS